MPWRELDGTQRVYLDKVREEKKAVYGEIVMINTIH